MVQVLDFGKSGDRFFMAMELVDGLNLRHVVNYFKRTNTPFPLEIAAFIVQQVALALEYAHEARDADGKPMRLVHRDVSPQNILISRTGQIKLCDFGIAKTAIKDSKTQLGVLKGTLRYMSPEQLQGTPLDQRSDQYSLGVVWYEMLTGVNLYSLKGSGENYGADFPAPSELRKELSGGIEKILRRMLSLEAPQRFASCKEVDLAIAAEYRHQPESEARARLAALIEGIMPTRLDKSFLESAYSNPVRRRRPSFYRFGAPVLGAFALIAYAWHGRVHRAPSPAARAPVVVTPTTQAAPTAVPAPPPPIHRASRKTPVPAKTVAAVPVGCPSGMALVPAGGFPFGADVADPDRNPLMEKTARDAAVPAFCMDEFEFPNRSGTAPKTAVAWGEANAACVAVGKRLCTEKEWEKACKGPVPARYSSATGAKGCNAGKPGVKAPGVAGASADCKSGYGIHDLSGNAEEWVREDSRFEADGHRAKGGSAAHPDWAARCSAVREYGAATQLPTLGFRCCRDS